MIKDIINDITPLEVISYIIQELDQSIDYDENDVPYFDATLNEIESYINYDTGISQWMSFRNAYFSAKHRGDCTSDPISCISCIYGDYLHITNILVPKLMVGNKQELKNMVTYRILCDDKDEFLRYHLNREEQYDTFSEEFLEYLGYLLRKNDINFQFLNNNFIKYD